MNECGILTRYNGLNGFISYVAVVLSALNYRGGGVHTVDARTYEPIDEAVVSRLHPLIYESVKGDDM